MAVIGTFGSFTAARLGIYASQAALNATGNNIANINTEGYTRQRMDQVSLYSYGGARYANNFQMNVGYGVLINSVSQLRDPLLDIRFREENASMGAYDEKLDCLQQLANILDEVGKGNDDFGIMEAQFDDLLSQLENLNSKVGSVEYDTTVRGSAQTLAELFNSYSNAMNTLAANKLKELKEDVKTVNALLTQIRDLNVQIRDAGIIGDQALELRDARNVCIDKLSSYMKIDVRYDQEKIDEFNSVERINISIAGSGTPLIRGVYGAQISLPDMIAEKNLEHDPETARYDEFISKMYIDETTWELKIEYTNDPAKALKDDSGNLIRNSLDAVGALIEKLNDMKDEQIAAAQETFQKASDLQNEKASLTASETTLNGEIAALKEQLEELDEEADDYDPEAAEQLAEQLAAKEAELADIQAQLATNADDIAANEEEIENLKEKFGIIPDGSLNFDTELEQKIGDQYFELQKQLEENNETGLLGGTYFNAAEANAPYLRKDGTGTTWNVDEANQVPNALEGAAAENDLLMFVEPLVDVKGRYMRDANHQTLKETITLTDNELYGSLQSLREFLTEKGEFSSQKDPSDPAYDPNATEKRGIQYYQNALDALARKFAEAFNKANQLDFKDVKEAYETGEVEVPDPDDPTQTLTLKVFLDKNGVPLNLGTEDDPIYLTADYFDNVDEEDPAATELAYQYLETLRNEGQLTEKWSFYNGGVLFSNNGDNNDPTGITAGNITVSKGWMMGDVRILNTKKADGVEHSTANDNIYHMIQLMSEDMNYYPGEVVDNAMGGMTKKYFTGSFQERLADMNSVLGVDMQTTTLLYNEYTVTTLSLENSRQSVAGVDLNDEATNMMVYQKAYAAACKLMTTLDSMLDRLINGTI